MSIRPIRGQTPRLDAIARQPRDVAADVAADAAGGVAPEAAAAEGEPAELATPPAGVAAFKDGFDAEEDSALALFDALPTSGPVELPKPAVIATSFGARIGAADDVDEVTAPGDAEEPLDMEALRAQVARERVSAQVATRAPSSAGRKVEEEEEEDEPEFQPPELVVAAESWRGEVELGVFTLEESSLDAQGKRLCTLEAFLDGDVPFVSIACDLTAFPYGTPLRLPDLEAEVGRQVPLIAVAETSRTQGIGRLLVELCVSDVTAAEQAGWCGVMALETLSVPAPT